MKLDVFIEGETIDLCIPTLEFAEKSDWYKWFNHPHTTQFLEHGVFPNTKEKQIAFFKQAIEERLLFIITNKEHEAIGSTSLMDINYKTRSAGLGVVIGSFFRKNPLEALEAVARITEHAFVKLGMERIEAGQHIKLIPWSHRMSLIGYRLEGIFKNSFIKGIEKADTIRITAHLSDYQKIIASRGGYMGLPKKYA
ncbi:GNAT family N-acetyltransferase [Helicobacter kayseriensis]|nr:GNAT family protein [Helicobacter kayseriensis]